MWYDAHHEKWYGAKYPKGTLIEAAVTDDGAPQGTVILKMTGKVETGPLGVLVRAIHVTASDSQHRWWVKDGEGQFLQKEAFYHLCDGPLSGCEYKRPPSRVVHLGKIRLLGLYQAMQE